MDQDSFNPDQEFRIHTRFFSDQNLKCEKLSCVFVVKMRFFTLASEKVSSPPKKKEKMPSSSIFMHEILFDLLFNFWRLGFIIIMVFCVLLQRTVLHKSGSLFVNNPPMCV